jgi:hypothetical protein
MAVTAITNGDIGFVDMRVLDSEGAATIANSFVAIA